MADLVMLYAYIHQECGKPAFYYDHLPLAGEQRSYGEAAHINGDPMEDCGPRFCDSCGYWLTGIVSLKHFVKLEDLENKNEIS